MRKSNMTKGKSN